MRTRMMGTRARVRPHEGKEDEDEGNEDEGEGNEDADEGNKDEDEGMRTRVRGMRTKRRGKRRLLAKEIRKRRKAREKETLLHYIGCDAAISGYQIFVQRNPTIAPFKGPVDFMLYCKRCFIVNA